MNVNVFVTRVAGAVQNELLVLPLSSQAAIPPQYRDGWNYFATVDTGDRMFSGIDARAIEAEIAKNGFAVVKPTAPDRRPGSGPTD